MISINQLEMVEHLGKLKAATTPKIPVGSNIAAIDARILVMSAGVISSGLRPVISSKASDTANAVSTASIASLLFSYAYLVFLTALAI